MERKETVLGTPPRRPAICAAIKKALKRAMQYKIKPATPFEGEAIDKGSVCAASYKPGKLSK